MKNILFLTLALYLIVTDAVAGNMKISARSFGAIPNDGKCDVAAINMAIKAAKSPAIIEFESGTYNLFNENRTRFNLIVINRLSDLTLAGQNNSKGDPTTKFEFNVKELKNDLDTACPLNIYNSNNITVKNIIFDNKPSFATSGKIIKVDRTKDRVEVEIFTGAPHFDKMSCYSANSWNLKTRELLPVPALTIGANPKLFKHKWEKVPGANNRLYSIQGMKFAKYVKPGQGISWHFYVRNRGGAVFSAYCNNIKLENLHFYNSKGVTVGAQFCKNIIYSKVIIKPVAPQLAVGARDAFHLVCNDGTLLVEGSYVKGVRWDPFNIKSKFCVVSEIVDKRTLKCTVITGVTNLGDFTDSTAAFWVGNRPIELQIASVELRKERFKDAKKRSIRKFMLKLHKDLPDSIKVGSTFTPHIWNFDKAVIKDSVFEGNYGRSILYQGENLEITGCLFKNNAYANIALGPVDVMEGGFVRNIKIINNKFINSTWANTTSRLPRNGSIKIYQDCPDYKNLPYNDNIIIKNNLFTGINYNKKYSAISVMNAQNVLIEGNKYVDCLNKVYVDKKSSTNIKIKD